ncbi:MAG: PTS sugar transporter subunit IIA [Salinisphaeraceae bacterium]|jgi:PTS system nitrogen regulatory IIA component|nr:PTS sugar transporter subunit IIA [Salinisphaeraceae bacterium]
MNITEIVTADRMRVLDDVASKKRALERLSELLGEGTPYVTENEIFTALVGREKLGSTGIGHGVAIPHGRLKGVEECVGAMIRLEQPVDFGATDDAPVDILFGLIVPEKSTEEHLELLRALAEMFSAPDCLQALRQAGDGEALLAQVSRRAGSTGD